MLHLLALLVAPYLIANRADEIALARTAAPPSVSRNATVLVLGTKGYETAVQGTNGFVCLVERSWFGQFNQPGFLAPKEQEPNCLNKLAATSVLPEFLDRTNWLLAGASEAQAFERAKAGYVAHRYNGPVVGAMAYMMSKHGYLNDEVGGPLWPHVMFFVRAGQAALLGAGLDGSPLLTTTFSSYEPNIVFVPAKTWSDGSLPKPSDRHAHMHHH